jgi:hypothetical protein
MNSCFKSLTRCNQYRERYIKIHGNRPVAAQLQRTGKSAIRRLGSLIRELSDDEADDAPGRSSPAVSGDLGDGWRRDFDGYLGSKDQLGEMSLVEWWGVCSTFLLSFHCKVF